MVLLKCSSVSEVGREEVERILLVQDRVQRRLRECRDIIESVDFPSYQVSVGVVVAHRASEADLLLAAREQPRHSPRPQPQEATERQQE